MINNLCLGVAVAGSIVSDMFVGKDAKSVAHLLKGKVAGIAEGTGSADAGKALDGLKRALSGRWLVVAIKLS